MIHSGYSKYWKNAYWISKSLRSQKGNMLIRNLSESNGYKYYSGVEIKDGIAILRLCGPNKMNTISVGLQEESEKIFRDKIIGNSEVQAVVFISSKSDNFIAGADIEMIKEHKSSIKEITMRGHAFFEELKSKAKVRYFYIVEYDCIHLHL